MSPIRRACTFVPTYPACILARMSDSLLDEVLDYSDALLLDMADTSARSELRARHGVLARAAWSLSLLPARADKVTALAKLVLLLRDEVVVAHAREQTFWLPIPDAVRVASGRMAR